MYLVTWLLQSYVSMYISTLGYHTEVDLVQIHMVNMSVWIEICVLDDVKKIKEGLPTGMADPDLYVQSTLTYRSLRI